MKKNSYSPEEILSSIDGMQRAEPGYFLFTRIQQQIKKEETGNIPAGFKKLLVPLYASLVLFIGINLVSYIHFNEKPNTVPQSKQTAADAFAGEYGLETSVY